MAQELSDIPKTGEEAKRQKGPVPLVAIMLAFGLLAALILFFFPVFFGLD